MGMSPFRRGVNSETKKNFGNKQFKGGKKFWFERYRLPQNQPAPFVIVSGDYVDPNPQTDQIELDPVTGRAKEVKNAYYKVVKHKRKMFKAGKETYAEVICSAGHDPQNPQPCAGCMAMDSGDKTVTRSEQFLFTIVHLNPYHTHPLVDRQTGQLVQKKAENGGGYVMVDTECTGKRTCSFCALLEGKPVKDPAFPKYNPADIGTIVGKRRYLEVGKGHLSNLAGWDSTIRSQCGNCKSSLELAGYACSTCNTMNIDASNDTRSDGELEEAVSRPYPCVNCKRATMHREVVGCQPCESMNKVPVQPSLFGVVLWGSRQGEGTKSQLMLARFETPEEYTAKVPANLLGGKTVQQIVAETGKPYNFKEVMPPESVSEQAEKLELGPGFAGPVNNPPQTPFMTPSINSAFSGVIMPQQNQAQTPFLPVVPTLVKS